MWPEWMKASLAKVAVKSLTSIPENAGKHIDTQMINSLFDHSVSYVGLCQLLEDMGFFLDRADFARKLLAAVPSTTPTNASQDLQRPTAEKNTTTSAGSMQPPPSDTGFQAMAHRPLGQNPTETSQSSENQSGSTQRRVSGRLRKVVPPAQPTTEPRTLGYMANPSPNTAESRPSIAVPNNSIAQENNSLAPSERGASNSKQSENKLVKKRRKRRTKSGSELNVVPPDGVHMHNPKSHGTAAVSTASESAARNHYVSPFAQFASHAPPVGIFTHPNPNRRVSESQATGMRTTSEIIDLTQDGSDNGVLPSITGKRRRGETHAMPSKSRHPVTANGLSVNVEPSAAGGGVKSHISNDMATQHEQGVPRKRYDPKTIASDVLRVAGIHPWTSPPDSNFHQPMQKSPGEPSILAATAESTAKDKRGSLADVETDNSFTFNPESSHRDYEHAEITPANQNMTGSKLILTSRR